MSNMHTDQFDKIVKNMLRAELKRKGMTYADLVIALAAIGVQETEAAMKNKISRGRFSASFFVQVMKAIDVEWIQIPKAA